MNRLVKLMTILLLLSLPSLLPAQKKAIPAGPPPHHAHGPSKPMNQPGYAYGHPHPSYNSYHRPYYRPYYRPYSYRPYRRVVYHPYWGPQYSYMSRWIFFPHYNFYWDNMYHHYVFFNGVTWISQPTAPSFIININLNKEKHYELGQPEDEIDDVYKDNSVHQENYK